MAFDRSLSLILTAAAASRDTLTRARIPGSAFWINLHCLVLSMLVISFKSHTDLQHQMLLFLHQEPICANCFHCMLFVNRFPNLQAASKSNYMSSLALSKHLVVRTLTTFLALMYVRSILIGAGNISPCLPSAQQQMSQFSALQSC